MIDILVISISSPIKIGIYKDNILIDNIEKEGMTSDILPIIFKELLGKYEIKTITYVNTPGSYMAIKVAYVFLKTLCIVKNIKLNAASGFLFNENSPIKALGKKYFFNKNDKVIIDFLEEKSIISDFKLPKSLDKTKFSSETLPIYNLPAV
ncbi:MAG: hypothetical protein C0626_11500 [Arcobacter sp.]|uniref:hypothetical protein n=1 Tax=uncultured Arcobacter sp. TaxID=165434 RepID=UPI000CAA6C39|nr:hypothetical protein [uncultured Arcobacter sp.]PLY09581.1 MAG: hypothetical protein C0626_11500 [Arcobacter sp.]